MKSNLTTAISSLSDAILLAESRLMDILNEISAIKLRKKTEIEDLISVTIPDISEASFLKLKRNHPYFSEPVIVDAFKKHNRYWLYKMIFKIPDYDSDLLMIQTRFKHYLETKSDSTKIYDRSISRLDEERKNIVIRKSQAINLLQTLKQAHDSKKKLSPEVSTYVNKLAKRSTTTYSQRTTSVDYSSNDDILFYMMTDVPTSFRTMLLNEMNQPAQYQSMQQEIVGGGQAGGAGASGDWDYAPATPNANDRFEDQYVLSTPVIATDDSLGAFS